MDVRTAKVALRVRRDRAVHKVRAATVHRALDDHQVKAAIAHKAPAGRRVKVVQAAHAHPVAAAIVAAIAD